MANEQHLTRENMDMAEKGNPYERNWISPNSSTAIRTNHIKARIDKVQQNSKCGGRDETINHIISEYSKLAQKEY